ncbi:hypothetical protein IAU60_001591 [Kwoniella sp. DSM 27419]
MSTNPVHSSTNLFRRLAWQSSVPISVRLADGEPGAGSGADRYFIQAPRYSYLPLLLPELRDNLVELALDEGQLEATDEKDWWLEEEIEEEAGGFASQGACRWHWSIDLIDLHSTISRPRTLPEAESSSSSSSSSSSAPSQLNLLLHLSNPPADKLLMPNNVETCKNRWLNEVKEADFVRWRNTSRVTNLRKADLEAGWDGIVQDDYDLYLRMASRILPLPLAPPATSLTSPGSSRPASTEPSVSSVGSSARPESSYTTRAIPIKLYLPDNAPVIQDVIPPIGPDGKPTTLISLLRQHLPLLFHKHPRSAHPYAMAFPLAQGILIPPETELGWMAASVCGADGWVRIGICIRAQ